MKKVISTERKPIKLWLENIEAGALEQAKNLANLPFIFKWIALMSDCHLGFGMPIGGVLATKGVVIPNAVGVDISCGVAAIKSNLTIEEMTEEKIKQIFGGSEEYHGGIRTRIPVGFNHYKELQDEKWMPVFKLDEHKYKFFEGDHAKFLEKSMRAEYPICYANYEAARRSVGSLGGGNHFLELQVDEKGIVWIMVHSGSRNLGFKVATHYNKLAKELNAKWFSSVNSKWDLAFLPIDSEAARLYMNEMNYCVEFSFKNREHMLTVMKEEILKVFPETVFDDIINIAHNYAAWENHYGENVIVHRKGATRARKGETGIIPGSMGTSSYIVEGLGNPESFMSCSHGAGRLMSRTKAKATLDLKAEKEKMKGIICGLRNVGDLDEAPGSYKDIEDVMDAQKDLVKILVKLRPIANIKG